MGIFSATMASGGALGLILGGVLTSELGWRWCLYINVLLSMVTLIGGPRVLPRLPGRREVHIDLPSVLLGTAGIAALIYGLGEAASLGRDDGWIIGSITAAVVLLALFVGRQVCRPNPLLPLRIVWDRNRGWALIALVVNGISTFGLMLVLTYQLQAVMHNSALRTGLALLPFAVTAAV